MKNDDWIFCESCRSEYKVVSSISNELAVTYCPFCGNENEDELEFEYIDDEE
jgi:hypothetical protein